jgi:2-polyprenyl-3-methyl-5-hydroxy-6-metoxy-1,4-benzoquinol methylase
MDSERINNLTALGKRRVCPPHLVRIMDNFLRPLLHSSKKVFGPHLRPGMMVLDVGCGGGFASLGMAWLVGENGRVIAADLQPEMLAVVKERAKEAGLIDRITIHRCNAYQVGVREELDFAVAFWMVHEVQDTKGFLEEIFSLLKPGGRFLIAEPWFHVTRNDFKGLLEMAEGVGFTILDRPRVRFSRAVVLERR